MLHRTFADVNEEGTEATAATAVVMAKGFGPKMEVFCADHPFLFLTRDNGSGSVLFLGRVVNPLGGPS